MRPGRVRHCAYSPCLEEGSAAKPSWTPRRAAVHAAYGGTKLARQAQADSTRRDDDEVDGRTRGFHAPADGFPPARESCAQSGDRASEGRGRALEACERPRDLRLRARRRTTPGQDARLSARRPRGGCLGDKPVADNHGGGPRPPRPISGRGGTGLSKDQRPVCATVDLEVEEVVQRVGEGLAIARREDAVDVQPTRAGVGRQDER